MHKRDTPVQQFVAWAPFLPQNAPPSPPVLLTVTGYTLLESSDPLGVEIPSVATVSKQKQQPNVLN